MADDLASYRDPILELLSHEDLGMAKQGLELLCSLELPGLVDELVDGLAIVDGRITMHEPAASAPFLGGLPRTPGWKRPSGRVMHNALELLRLSGALDNLEKLDLSEGHGLPLPAELGVLAGLEKLCWLDISGAPIALLSNLGVLQELPVLETLICRDVYFTTPPQQAPDHCRALFAALGACPRLRHIDLTGWFPGMSLETRPSLTGIEQLARLAVVPMALEARGLDVTPATVARFNAAGDTASARILQRIYTDEIRHVRFGTKWFEASCKERGLIPSAHWQLLIGTQFRGVVKGPFNDSARDSAGLTREYYAALA